MERDAVLWEDTSLGTEERRETILTSGVNSVDILTSGVNLVSDPISALLFPSEDFQLPAVLTDTISPRTSFQQCSFLSSLGPHPH